MTSQGQRFRRRALRRGYKVDEVDAFLDRVEATLAGDPVDAPVTAQEVHDVVFRVRFGGYDEWQVDLHLDRVERQLAEIEERGYVRGPDPRMAKMREERMPHGPMGPPPMRDDRMAPPMPARPGPPMAGPPMGAPPMAPPPAPPVRDPGYGRYDEPAYGGAFDGFEPGRHGKMDMTAEIRMGDPGYGHPSPAPPMPGGPGAAMPADVQRVDQIRRTFQPRRFGSGYDPIQVDRLFEGIISAMSSRGSVPISDAELDPGQFSLVPGGYFEAEVDAALKEVRDILRRR
ncbi:MAG TPA: DivIVA domain-containing protein [Micromonosporaceae bacterium]|nr:DivIVA domain-containing protein [Micromonosporaceae bacterium]